MMNLIVNLVLGVVFLWTLAIAVLDGWRIIFGNKTDVLRSTTMKRFVVSVVICQISVLLLF